jgi:hypothetical protein
MVDLKDIDPWLSQDTQFAALRVAGDQAANLVHRNPARAGDAGSLDVGGRGADVRVEAAGGAGQQVGRNRAGVFRVGFAEGGDRVLHAVGQLLVGVSEIGGAGRVQVISIVARGGGPGLKVLGPFRRRIHAARAHGLLEAPAPA